MLTMNLSLETELGGRGTLVQGEGGGRGEKGGQTSPALFRLSGPRISNSQTTRITRREGEERREKGKKMGM